MKADAGGVELGENPKSSTPRSGLNRGLSILDFILRLIAIFGTLASAISMGTTNETLPFFTRFVRFRAKYDDLPTFTFFVVANSIVSAYVVLSLPLSIFHIGMLALLTAGASAAAAIVYLAHNGNTKTNWFAICQQFNSFCEHTSGSLIGSFVGIVVLVLVIFLSSVAISRP
ncbi:hypothetical protein FEM48_Zijuj04G0046200 [Ziziphus jujuba var. spinosa]|uniref:CASP-like protein n=1 Tax=Ziziphus jujuba var. spinosa TaxID=714518 RepID=A0A978VHU6_ZIZJJ|nr:hypothetical protein FEM48_Zijuj04G0046200 [Ziziphus jujuba var. spinosa]